VYSLVIIAACFSHHLVSHPDLKTNPNAKIHVLQDQVTHMHRLSEYQNTVSRRIESIKTVLHDRMSQSRNKSEY
jgi:hypothetical protein